ncbi:MAG TPA: N-6 DNA methylase, partial [Clostridia bacterium]|nr:N-6 DNA methylase [Clostridia bacterium]
YHKGSQQHTFERFDTVRLASDPALLKRFVFLFGADRVVPKHGECHLNQLLSASETVGRELTNQFYALYSDIRQRVLSRLCRENSAIAPGEILRCTQKLLDRVLFCAFCEDRGLLPAESLNHAFEHRDPYNPRPIWHNFRSLFRAVDEGSSTLSIPAYNGGLFAPDPLLDSLQIPDDVCAHFRDLGGYDYRPSRQIADSNEDTHARPVIDVDILGHIFEQSITDLERIRLAFEQPQTTPGAPTASPEAPVVSRRKQEGAFYTPAFITRYILEQALGGVLQQRFETLRQRLETETTGTARKTLANPNSYDLAALNDPQRKALIRFWEAWQEELKNLRILDPACGSGAFLIEAFDQLHAWFDTSNARLEELRGQRTLFDLDRQILQHNLYGVDLNAEAVQICQLSLWIKTAARGKRLTSLDHTIREGNSVISDPAVHPKAFDWHAAFPEVFAQGGFDVVIGNPPYVRQELLTPFKPWLQKNYVAFHGMADLYVYFYELGLRVLKPGGLLSMIVTNKWMKAGYGEPLRKFFTEKAWIRSVVDFGHAKQIFEEADVFPSIIVAQKPTEAPKPKTARLCTIPREQLRIDDLSVQIEIHGADMDPGQLAPAGWQLEPRGVFSLLDKIWGKGIPLRQFTGAEPLSGIKTGYNDAYLINNATRQELLKQDERSGDLIKPYLRGQDFGRWRADTAGWWMIVLASSENQKWPWSDQGVDAEQVFAATFPAVSAHLGRFRAELENRQDQGRFWWELRSCAYWSDFGRPKIMYPEITWRLQWCLDLEGTLCNNTAYFVPSADPWVIAVANSPVSWWFAWRRAMHGKDEALRFIKAFVQDLPIPEPTTDKRQATDSAVRRLIEITSTQQQTLRTVLDWLRVEYSIEKPSNKLQALADLDSDTLIGEVKRIRGKKHPLTAAGVQALRTEYTRTIAPAHTLAAEALQLERQLSDLVNQAYDLTP